MAEASPFRAVQGGVRVAIRLTPKAGRNGIAGLKPCVDGAVELGVSVTAAPERGKANQALLKLLARTWAVPLGDLDLIAGDTDRHKVVHIKGGTALSVRLDEWLKEIP